jgi:Ca2+-binding EF-hand superfamily protein
MVNSIGSTSNLIQVITSNFQTSSSEGIHPGNASFPLPGPPPDSLDQSKIDPLGVFDTVDTDSDGSISEAEFNILTEGILEVTGSIYARNFLELDGDGDGQLNGVELKSVLDEAGFAPPPPPPELVMAAYEAQSLPDGTPSNDDLSLLQQLLEYLENRDSDVDLMV